MNIIDLLVSLGFVLIAILTYYLMNNDVPAFLDPAKDDSRSARVMRLNRKIKDWIVIIICIVLAIGYFIKAF